MPTQELTLDSRGVKNMIDFERNLTPTEVAEILGVSRDYVYEWCHRRPEAGGIPNYKIGRLVKIRESDLQKWIDDHRRN